MKWQGMAGLAILAVVVGAWGLILFKPNNRPDLMGALAGCYRGEGPLSGVDITLAPEGLLTLQGQSFRVVVTEDKGGLSLLPDRRISYDPMLPSKLVIGSSTPLLLRIDNDRQSIAIPGTKPDILFNKVACPHQIEPSP